MKIKSLRISHTALSKWRRSPRQFYYEHVLALKPRPLDGFEPKSGSALAFGSAFHKFAELYTPDADVNAAIDSALLEAPLPEEGDRSKAHLRTLCGQYATAFPPTEGSCEVELEFKINDRVTYVAHIDKIITTADGRTTLIDYKTTSKHLRWDFAKTVAPNAQACGYIYAAQVNGYAVDAFTFRGVSTDRKLLDPTYRPKKRTGEIGERPPQFLDVSFVATPDMLAEWLAAVTKDVDRLVADIESGLFTCHCGIGDHCSFRDACALTSPEDRAILLRNEFDVEEFRGFALETEE